MIFDATHSVQLPSGACGVSGGERQFVMPLVRAAAAFGVDGIFCEVAPEPKKALCDRATSLRLKDVEPLLKTVLKIRKVC